MRRQDSSETREGEAENRKQTSAREDSAIVRLAYKKNDISSREIVEDLKLNVSALMVRLRIKNTGFIICIKRKRPYISKQNIANIAKKYWPLQEDIFRRF
ncbi:hypothetical protein AVEN_255887-1 [Araneus ventricosus]|uniref:Transposase Tc1-like domain-containing protein n=1 Tax=Araneus ventricosus TaxID=182803 RepID=A0A4Y2DDK9_ARAVE|nr:hypothetical protein AVEN_255887-1 [Araneus ventricosus]